MKFAKHLLKAIDLSDPEWLPFWINYKRLKKGCKRLGPEENGTGSRDGSPKQGALAGGADGGGGEAGGDPAAPVAGGGDGGGRAQAELLACSKAETQFFKALKGEVQKCAEFFNSVEGHMRVRLARLQVS
ncbi:hypothetical protein JKP88DRAFT_280326 [Tribonema minus]|uniref:SPX domain-containing protein n=1 Tax=Tribonema minus TaxID=303371 RepID=A0A835YPW9_9STRA|nr:hypothetical protein JKP88DRAFT_280326 [Tribonema minus]